MFLGDVCLHPLPTYLAPYHVPVFANVRRWAKPPPCRYDLGCFSSMSPNNQSSIEVDDLTANHVIFASTQMIVQHTSSHMLNCKFLHVLPCSTLHINSFLHHITFVSYLLLECLLDYYNYYSRSKARLQSRSTVSDQRLSSSTEHPSSTIS